MYRDDRDSAREPGMTDEAICAKLDERVKSRGKAYERLIDVRDTYHGDIVIPLPELDEKEQAAVPNLLALGLDGTSERTASTMPSIYFPEDADGDGPRARRRARQRAEVVYSWWDASSLDIRLYRRARYYHGYGQFISFVRPSAQLGAPSYELRDPLTSYPSDEASEDFYTNDCIFTSRRTGSWVAERFPDAERMLAGAFGDDYESRLLQLVEYVDDDEWVFLARIDSADQRQRWETKGRPMSVRLLRIPNRIGMCPVVLGGRFGLARTMGQFDSLVGIYWTQAKLQALETIAVTRDVFPNVWVIGQDGQNPQIIQEPDGLRDIRGEIRNGTIMVEQSHPGYTTPTSIDRLERNARVTGRIPSEYGGEAGTNIRTGRRGDAIISATVDFTVQEAQRTIQRALRCENMLAIAIDRAYYGQTTKTIYLGTTGSKKQDTYTPADLWTSDRHDVAYTHAGSDANQLTIGLLQLNGAGAMSKYTLMRKHPMIDNPEREHDMLQVETLEQALLGSVGQMAAQGQLPPSDLARLMQLVRNDKMELADAVIKVQEEAQQRQAQQVPPDSAAAQPGIALPGAGAEAATVPPVEPGMRNLQSLLGATRLINMRTPNEMAPVGNVNAAVA